MGVDVERTSVNASASNDLQTPTEVTQGTDVHQSKIAPDDPRLRIDRPKGRTLKRGPVLLVGAVLAGLLAVGLVVALAGPTKDAEAKRSSAPTDAPAANPPLPDIIADPPSDAERHSASGGVGRGHTRAAGAPSAVSAEATTAATSPQAEQDELIKARAAAILVTSSEPALPPQPPVPDLTRRMETAAAPTPPATEPAHSSDPNLQERKNEFLARAGVSDAEYLDKSISPPRSPYEVQAGSIIPAVLITGINSDLPGQIVAQVRENVYDSVTGNYLLIPQGSRLLAAYDSMVAWGQQRVLVCWNRLIRPDGSSMTLDCMPGVDLAGSSGFRDEVDNHWWRIIGGAAVSSLLAATAQRSQGDVSGYQPSLPQSWASGTAAGINEAGQQLTAKNLQLQPTITVRPGYSVNVLVTKDMVIAPYARPPTP